MDAVEAAFVEFARRIEPGLRVALVAAHGVTTRRDDHPTSPPHTLTRKEQAMDLQAWRDQQRASIRDSIRRRGWSIQYVGGGECSRPGCTNHDDDLFPFGYTIGLYGMDHPELLILGADTHTTAHVLDALGQRIKEGEMLMPGMLLTIDGWPHRIVPEPVPNPGEILLSALEYYRRPAEYPVPALQLTYDDDAGRFPWEDGFAAPDLQPRPGTFTA